MSTPATQPPAQPPARLRRRRRKLTPEVIANIHRTLPVDCAGAQVQGMADLLGLSYSTVWHVVRGYSRDAAAPWRLWPSAVGGHTNTRKPVADKVVPLRQPVLVDHEGEA